MHCLKKPELSDIEIKIELFKAFYRFDFDQETLSVIAEEMKQFLIKESIDKQKNR